MSESLRLVALGPQPARPAPGAARGSAKEDEASFNEALHVSEAAELKHLEHADSMQAKAAAGKEKGQSKPTDGQVDAEAASIPLLHMDPWMLRAGARAPAQNANAVCLAGGGTGVAMSSEASVAPAGAVAKAVRADFPTNASGKMASAAAVGALGAAVEAAERPATARPLLEAATPKRAEGGTPADRSQALPGVEGAKGPLVEAIGDDGRQHQPRLFAEAKSPEGGAPKITVVSVHSAPAPALATPHSGSQTVSALVQTLAAAPAFKVAAADAIAGTASARGEVLHTLKIQLHPSHLGVVTAKLRLVGDQLAVELHSDSAEARHRLTVDSDTMAKALRSLGYDVDRVTVHQAPSHGASVGSQGSARQQSFHSTAGNGGNGGWGERSGGDGGRENQAGQGRGHSQPPADRGGIYI